MSEKRYPNMPFLPGSAGYLNIHTWIYKLGEYIKCNTQPTVHWNTLGKNLWNQNINYIWVTNGIGK